VPGDFAVVDDRLLLSRLLERCRKHGVSLQEQTTLLNLAWINDRVIAETTHGRYRARVVVDAAGGSSPIAATFRLHRLHGFYAVFGALLRGITLHTENIVLAFVERLGDPPPILEVIPCGRDSAYCVVFVYARELTEPQALEGLFQSSCRHNRFFSMTDAANIAQTKLGAIPIGAFHRRRLSGVIHIGEAALVQPPLLGTAFNEMLQYSAAICDYVVDFLRSSSKGRRELRYRFPFRKRLQDRLQMVLTRSLLRNNVEAFDRLVRSLSYLPPSVVFKLFSNELAGGDIAAAIAGLSRQLIGLGNPAQASRRMWRH
jgi:flavin-dependent dehydrogenase